VRDWGELGEFDGGWSVRGLRFIEGLGSERGVGWLGIKKG
jgi:hypothetical protein